MPRAYTVGYGRLIQFIKTLVMVWPGELFKAELADISGLHGNVHKYPMMPPQVENMLQTHDRLATCPSYTFPRIGSNPTTPLKSRSRKEWVDEINLTFCLCYIWIFSVYDTVMLQKTHVLTNAKKQDNYCKTSLLLNVISWNSEFSFTSHTQTWILPLLINQEFT